MSKIVCKISVYYFSKLSVTNPHITSVGINMVTLHQPGLELSTSNCIPRSTDLQQTFKSLCPVSHIAHLNAPERGVISLLQGPWVQFPLIVLCCVSFPPEEGSSITKILKYKHNYSCCAAMGQVRAIFGKFRQF